MALRVGLPDSRGSAIHWAGLIATTKNLYALEDLEVEDVPCTYDELDAGILSGELPIIRRGPDVDITLMEAGHPLRIVVGLVLKPAVGLYTRSDVTSVEQLKGRTFGAIAPKLGSTLLLRMLLVDSGFTESDYRIVVYGDTSRRLAALRKGEVDGALLAPPWSYRADNEGFKRLVNIAERYPGFPYSSAQANTELARRDPESVVKFVRATLRAQRWLYDPANKEEAIAMLARASGISDAESRATYAEMVEHDRVYPEAGEIGAENLRILVNGLRQTGDMPQPRLRPEEYVDLTFLQRARAGL